MKVVLNNAKTHDAVLKRINPKIHYNQYNYDVGFVNFLCLIVTSGIDFGLHKNLINN